MPTRYYISLPDPARARGGDAELSFRSQGADGFASELQQALQDDALFQRWRAKQDEPDEVDPALGATDPTASVSGSQDDLHIDLVVTPSLPASVLRHRLGFTGVRDLLATFIAFGADVLLGAVILVVGYWLADVAARAIQRANPDRSVGLSRIARVAILGLVIAMGLRAMGIADDIVNLAFGLVLGAVAVATALAFGLGGRDAAGRVADRWARAYLERRGDNDPRP